MYSIISIFLTAVFFVIYFKILSLFDFPISALADIVIMFLIVVVILPASFISATKLMDLIKKIK
ncbi:hypothetical protein [Sedimentibacter sp.]|uniref:hypothetical protein n=1 Tax=Sedimentibacter sp. TaxID=1960295 RepID=UPI0028AD92AD|nr:hypothetical protein [Sedimentibacter sp.]